MPRVLLTGGTYQSRSIIASAQEAVNVYAESNPQAGSPPVPVTYYPTPGLDGLSVATNIEAIRTLYRASNGNLYAVVGPSVYAVSNTFVWTLLGTVPDNTTPVWFSDNGLCIVIVDGSTIGYAIRMSDNAFGQITDPNFYGARSADYQDTYFIFNRPLTAQFYISLSNVTFEMLTGTVGAVYSGVIGSGGAAYAGTGTYNAVPLTGGTGSGAQATIVVAGGVVASVTITAQGSGYVVGDVLSASNANIGGSGAGFAYDVVNVHGAAFDPLDIAAKSGADNIVAAKVIHGELWLIGELTTDIDYDAGAADFAYQRIQGAFVDHGCAAPNSIAAVDISLFWLSQDRQGDRIVVMTDGYGVKGISPPGLVAEFQTYATVSDAIGYCHQIGAHAFYVLTFPTADKTYAYDLTTGQWHRRASIDGNGVLHRHRSNCFAFAYGYNLVGDYQNGSLYSLTNAVFTDDGTPIPRRRTFPHISPNGKRRVFQQFQADMATGQQADGGSDNPPYVSLRFSNDRGFSYGNPVMQSMGATGQYITSMQWQRIGLARDGVFELSWSANADTALNGAWVRYVDCLT